jgi:hypothetical protein
VNAILWLESWRYLVAGTQGGECRVGSSNTTTALAPTNVEIRRETKHGCADVAPAVIGNTVVFLQILADGMVHPPRTVAGGAITLDWPASKVTAGLGYVSRLETLPLEAGQPEGTAQGRRRRIDQATVRLHRSLGGKVGCDPARLAPLVFRRGDDPLDEAEALYTGDKTVPVASPDFRHPTLWVVQDDPLPLNVVAIVPRITAHD